MVRRPFEFRRGHLKKGVCSHFFLASSVLGALRVNNVYAILLEVDFSLCQWFEVLFLFTHTAGARRHSNTTSCSLT